MINNIYVLSSNLRNRKEKILVWEAPVIALVRVLRSFFVILVKNTKISRNIWWQKLNTHILYIMWTCAKENNHKTQPPVSPTASKTLYNIQYPPARKQSQVIHQFFLLIKIYKKESKSQRLYYILLTFFSHAVTNFCCVLHT